MKKGREEEEEEENIKNIKQDLENWLLLNQNSADYHRIQLNEIQKIISTSPSSPSLCNSKLMLITSSKEENLLFEKYKSFTKLYNSKFKNPISCNTNNGEFISSNISSEYLVLNSLRVYGKARCQELKESCEILGVKFIY